MPITDSTPPPMGMAKKPAATARRMSRKEERAEALNGLGQLAQIPLLITKQYADAGAVSAHWPGIAKEVSELAEKNESVAKLVDPLMQVGPYAGLIAAVLPLVLQLAVNHKFIQAGAMGTVPPGTLAAQVEAAIAQQEVEALRVQLESERQSRALKDEIEMSRMAMADAMRDHQMAETDGK